MFGFAKLFEQGKAFFHHPDGNVDIDLQSPNNYSELRQTGGTCAECIWMTGMTSQAMQKCNSCEEHKNFTPMKQARSTTTPKKRTRDR